MKERPSSEDYIRAVRMLDGAKVPDEARILLTTDGEIIFQEQYSVPRGEKGLRVIFGLEREDD